MCGGGGNKGMDTETYRNHYRNIRDQFDTLYKTEMPKLQQLQQQLTGQLSDYLGQIAPVAKDTLHTASQLGKVYAEQYLPAVQQFMQTAQGYDTPERRAMARGQAMTDVGVAGDAARDNALQKLESYGVDPSMTRSAGMDAELRTQTALAQAQAANRAEQQVEQTGIQLQQAGLQAGQNLGSQYGDLTKLGAGIAGSGMSAIGNAANAYGNLQNLGTSLLGGKASMVDAMLQAKGMEQSAKGGSSAGAIGSLVGTVGGAALGAFGGPAGMMAGAQLGGALGGGLGGAMGGGQAAPMMMGGGYSNLPTSWSSQSSVPSFDAWMKGAQAPAGSTWTNEYW